MTVWLKDKEVAEELASYGLEVRWADWKDAEPIDFDISDEEDNVAWVWGKTPDDIQVECTHPYVEYTDDETRGECPLCGDTCDWHKVPDEEPYREPYEWHGNSNGGLIKKIIKEVYDNIIKEVYDNQRREQSKNS